MTIRSPTPSLRVWIDPHSLGKGARVRHRILTIWPIGEALVENRRAFVGRPLPRRRVRPNRAGGDTAKGISMTRILAPWLLLAAFLLFPSLIVAGVAHAQDRSPEALAPFAARELAPGIHLLATPPDFLGPAISNVSIIEQSDGIVLIDSG